jgi:hypothetical protein
MPIHPRYGTESVSASWIIPKWKIRFRRQPARHANRTGPMRLNIRLERLVFEFDRYPTDDYRNDEIDK